MTHRERALKFLEWVDKQTEYSMGIRINGIQMFHVQIMARVILEQMAAMKGVMGYCRRVGLDEGSIFDSVHGVLEQALVATTAQLAALENE